MDRGAACYLADKDYDVLIPGVIVTDIRKAMALCACMFFGHPSKKLDLIGITGTKGKTTVSYMTKAVLQQAGRGYGPAQLDCQRHGPPLRRSPSYNAGISGSAVHAG